MKRGRINRNHGIKPPRYRHQIEDNKRLWNIWNGIKKRCLFETEPRYVQYGARGITICDEWRSFDNFADWAYDNGYSDNLTIERINVNGNYCPENCKWISLKEQACNKQDTIWVDYNGEHIQLRKLCKNRGLKYDPIHNRIRVLGWDIERAIDTPLYTNENSLMGKCKERKLNYSTIRDRIVKLGWTEEEALSVPTGIGRHGSPLKHGNRNAICERCGTEFIKMNGMQRFCCSNCREESKKERRKQPFLYK